MKDGQGVCERERVCVTVCVSWCHSHYGVYICTMCIFVYHGVMAIVEAGQNVCESVYMHHVYVCVSWCHSHYVGWTKCVCECVYMYHVFVYHGL